MTEEKKDLGFELIKLLGLPEHVTRLEVVFAAGKPPSIKCEYFIHGSGAKDEEIIAQFAEYELVKKE